MWKGNTVCTITQYYKNREESEFTQCLGIRYAGKNSPKRTLSHFDLESWTRQGRGPNTPGAEGRVGAKHPRPRAGTVKCIEYLETLLPKAVHFWSLILWPCTHSCKVISTHWKETRKPGCIGVRSGHTLGGGQSGLYRTRNGCFISSTENAL